MFDAIETPLALYGRRLGSELTMPSKDSKREKAREVVDILEEISMLLVGRFDTSNMSL